MSKQKTKIKIIYVITKSNWGGAQRYVYELATSLPRDKFEVSVAAGGRGLLGEKLAAAGIRLILIPGLERDINPIKEGVSLFSLWKIFRQEHPDIIHLSSSKAGGLGAFAARISKLAGGRPEIIFTVHGWAFNEDRNFLSRSVIYFLQWVTTLLSDHVIIISSHDYRQALKMPLVADTKFVLIPNGIEKPDFLDRASARKYLASHIKTREAEQRSLWLITIAELTKNKGLSYLVEAAGRLEARGRSPKLKIMVVGEGEERLSLENLISKWNLQDVVCFPGFIREASRYLKAGDIFVLPSVKEGLSYVIMEAMAAGLPIVASGIGGITDLVQEGVNGILVPPKSPEALAEALGKLLADEELRKSCGQLGKRLWQEQFAFGKMFDKTERLYRGANAE